MHEVVDCGRLEFPVRGNVRLAVGAVLLADAVLVLEVVVAVEVSVSTSLVLLVLVSLVWVL